MPILIVNQDDVFLKELQYAFEARNHRVIATTDSMKAVKLFVQHKPSAVILNISMPDKDGFEITKEIRAFCKKTFILAVSTNQNYLRAIKKLGANEALPYISETTAIVRAIKFL